MEIKVDPYYKSASQWAIFDAFIAATQVMLSVLLVLLPAFYIGRYPNLLPVQPVIKLVLLAISFGVALSLTFIITKHQFQFFYPKITTPPSSPALPGELANRDYWIWWATCYWTAVFLAIVLAVVFMILTSEGNYFQSSRVFKTSFLFVVLVVGITNLQLPAFVQTLLQYKAKKLTGEKR